MIDTIDTKSEEVHHIHLCLESLYPMLSDRYCGGRDSDTPGYAVQRSNIISPPKHVPQCNSIIT